MKNKVIKTINRLVTNVYLENNIKSKLHVCHFLFSSYILTESIQSLDFAIALLKETLKFSYARKKYAELYFIIDYSICITSLTDIDLEIDELISTLGTIPSKSKGQTYLYEHQNFDFLVDATHTKGELVIENHKPCLLLLLIQLKNETINSTNYIHYIQKFNDNYNTFNDSIYLIFISIIAYKRNRKDILLSTFSKLKCKKLKSIPNDIFNFIYGEKNKIIKKEDDLSIIIQKLSNKKMDLDIMLLQKLLINGHAKYHIG